MRFQALPFRAALAAAIALCPGAGIRAQSRPDDAPRPPAAMGSTATPPVLDASTELGGMQIDGRIDEPQWANARVFEGFVQRQPDDGQPAEHLTQVRVLFGDDAIWVAGRMFDPDPASIDARLNRRDNLSTVDVFGVGLDPDRDGLTGYIFEVSAANVQSDSYVSNDDQFDGAWDAVWASAVAIDEQGWTAEIRIPLSQIRYEASDEPQAWGVSFRRRRTASNEDAFYPHISQLRRGRISQFGQIENVRVATVSRRLEALPYVLSSVHSGPATPGDPFFDGTSSESRVGVDLSYGLGAAFTLDATINPDFGQVEADPAVINLSAFETFFEERRPFFVQDARVFDFGLSGGGRLFYSRRVGRAPQGRGPSGSQFTEVPQNATILGAAKLSGRTSSGLSVGALAALTGNEHARAQLSDGSIDEYLVEPRAEYGTVSVMQDFRGGASQIGVLTTAMRRDLTGDGSFDWLPSSAYSAGVRFNHLWADRAWAVFGYFSGSHVRGDEAAITRIQRSSIHYFQRPDATRFAPDTTATSLSGRDWRVTLEKRNGEHWTGSVWAAEVTNGFDVNDLGYSTRTEVLDGGTQITYREIRPGTLFRSYSLGVRTFYNWSHEALDDTWSIGSWHDARTGGSYNVNAFGEFLNYWGVNANVRYAPPQVSRRQTRGGPMMEIPSTVNANVNFYTDGRRPFSVGVFLGLDDARRGIGGGRTAALDMTLRPNDNLTVWLSPRYYSSRTGEQYVTATGTLPYAPTYGTRYLFADLEQRQLSLETSVDWTFSPTLSLQVYAQQLLSSGDFLRYKQLAAPKSYDFTVLTPTVSGDTLVVDFDGDAASDYSFTDRDFNVRSLIGNAVLRWEYRPGSTVFLVWQRTQDDQAGVGDFDFSRDAGALFRAPADNRFILKVNYWLGL